MVDEASGNDRRLASMVSVRFAPLEDERLRAEAQKRGESVSTFVRHAVLRQLGMDRPPTGPTPSRTSSAGLQFDIVGGARLVQRTPYGLQLASSTHAVVMPERDGGTVRP